MFYAYQYPNGELGAIVRFMRHIKGELSESGEKPVVRLIIRMKRGKGIRNDRLRPDGSREKVAQPKRGERIDVP